jgi:hypothetical protein
MCMYVRMYACMYVYVRAYVCVCMYVCVVRELHSWVPHNKKDASHGVEAWMGMRIPADLRNPTHRSVLQHAPTPAR